MDDIKQFKQACLLEEHAGLSGFVEQEMVATALTRALAVAAWLVGTAVAVAGEAGTLAIVVIVFPAIFSFWVTDVWFSYVGVVYKMRRLEVRRLLAEMPAAAPQAVAEYTTPTNPFDGVVREDKMQALRDALLSPAVFLPYVVLELATVLLLLVR
jgi:hypothetical protein